MRPLFRGDGCTINEAGISVAGNPLTRAFDAIANDPLHARQMRDGFAAGIRPPMGMMGPGGHMLDSMMAKPGGLDAVWNQVAPVRPPPMGPRPALGAVMPEQLMRHMEGPPGVELREPGFFGEGTDWVQEFGDRRHGPRGFQVPPHAAVRPPGPDWAAEFAAGPMHHRPVDMEAIFHQAHMAAAFAEASSSSAFPPRASELEAAWRQTAASSSAGPDVMEAAFAAAAPIGPADMEAAFQEAQMEAAFKEAQAEQILADQADLGQAAQMVEMLRSSGNPKFVNSHFVSFIDKVSKGDLQFKENTVIDRDGNQVDWDTLYDTAAATASEAETTELENLWKASARPELAGLNAAWADANPRLEEAWKAGGLQQDPNEAFLEKLWETSGGSEAMADAWRLAEDEDSQALLDQAWMAGDLNMDHIWANSSAKNSEYKFQDSNPYLDCPDPLAEAQRLIREGRDREALLALEAEVQRNPESSEGWRQLGQLHAELDQDIEAIRCLRRGHEVDPYNLDSLLALGVSYTNELDQLPALRYLRLWIENHEEHQGLVQGLEPPAEYEYEAWRQQVTALYHQAAQMNPLDADVFVALGVMENINRNYDAAIRALATACRLRPNDHTVWNKLGATLANSGKSEQAVVAYHQGLQLKPNYARSWSNLAIAHSNLGQHADAARFYLSSLVLNPDATHIWNFLHSAVLNMDAGVQAFEAIDQRDLAKATQVIDGVLDPATLPKPRPELPQPPDEILASIGL